jgi:hypothetical protein
LRCLSCGQIQLLDALAGDDLKRKRVLSIKAL